MAASTDSSNTDISDPCVECSKVKMNETSIPFNDTSHKNRQTESVSMELLYPEKFSDCYQQERLSIIGKMGKVPQDEGKTFMMPQSSVLSKIKDFLPQLSQANKRMASHTVSDPENADKVNIEVIDSDEKPYVEMDLSMIPTELLGDSDTSEDDSTSESESGSETEKEQLKLAPRSVKHVKPGILVLDCKDCVETDVSDR